MSDIVALLILFAILGGMWLYCVGAILGLIDVLMRRPPRDRDR